MSGQLKCVLFDFDDTLIDWSGVELSWYELEAPRLIGVHTYLSSLTDRPIPAARTLIDDYQERTMQAWASARHSLIAPHMPSILIDSLSQLGIDRALLERDALLRAYNWNVVPGTSVFPDVFPMLKTLRSAGLKLGIVTNASQPIALRDAEIAGHGLIDYFPDCRLAAADVGYLKPHRRIFEAALAQMKTAPQETVFIGDNPRADIAGALAVGMRAVQRMTHRGAKYDGDSDTRNCLHSLDELPKILDAWYPDWQNGSA